MNDSSHASPIAGPRMAPLFFHTAEEPLFGHYGPPHGSADRDHAVLLCPPIGSDYNRTHWRLRLLADQLMRDGYHVFRFDYSCLGDSWGDFEQARVPRWLDDIRSARTELEDNAGSSRLSIIGHRVGATLAYLAAGDMSLQHLILWDPIIDGRTHLATLRLMQRELKSTATANAPFESLLGYRHSAELIADLARLDLVVAPRPQAKRISFLQSGDDPASRRLYEQLPGSQWATCEATHWNDVPTYADALALGDAGRHIAALLEGSVS